MTVFLLNRKKDKTVIHNRRELHSRLKCLLGFRPKELSLYETAFIHRSATFVRPDGTRINNERLEFLGDAIIDSILSDYLFHYYPDASEGFMTKTRARIVSRDRLNRLGISMGLESFIVSNLSSPGIPPNLSGNALEALMGAIFIDRGYKKASWFFLEKVLGKHLNLNEVLNSVTDYKSAVLEYCQKNRLTLNYVVKSTPSDDTGFRVSLEINGEPASEGTGGTKKEAEQEASMFILEEIKSGREWSAREK